VPMIWWPSDDLVRAVIDGGDRGVTVAVSNGHLCPLTSTSTTVLRSSLAMAAIARAVKCSDRTSFN